MCYISHIRATNCRNVVTCQADLPFSRDSFSHFIITGPNGSGKTGLLNLIESCLQSLVGKQSFNATNPAYLSVERDHLNHYLGVKYREAVKLRFSDSVPKLFGKVRNDKFVLSSFSAHRKPTFSRVLGPKKQNFEPSSLHLTSSTANEIHQFMVNLKTKQAFSQRNEEVQREVDNWFSSFIQVLKVIFGDDQLTFKFDPDTFYFSIYTKGRTEDFAELSDGHSTALQIYNELMIRTYSVQRIQNDFTFIPEGIVLIDEPELHLHIRLQEVLLPSLTRMFPKIQFIVATHSPVIVSSIPNAIVLDLPSKNIVNSIELQGIKYGNIMVHHFGIEEDYDIDTTRKLIRLKELDSLPNRSEDENVEFNQLMQQLSEKSHVLALEIWNQQLKKKLQAE